MPKMRLDLVAHLNLANASAGRQKRTVRPERVAARRRTADGDDHGRHYDANDDNCSLARPGRRRCFGPFATISNLRNSTFRHLGGPSN